MPCCIINALASNPLLKVPCLWAAGGISHWRLFQSWGDILWWRGNTSLAKVRKINMPHKFPPTRTSFLMSLSRQQTRTPRPPFKINIIKQSQDQKNEKYSEKESRWILNLIQSWWLMSLSDAVHANARSPGLKPGCPTLMDIMDIKGQSGPSYSPGSCCQFLLHFTLLQTLFLI